MSAETQELIPGTSALTNAELDERLEEAVVLSVRSEKLVCCYLTEVRERHAYRDFGYSDVYDYAYARFGFKERKTRYLVALGGKLRELPQIREALMSEKIGWVKASRIAAVASKEDETMWLDSALSMTVQELDRRIKDGTEGLRGMLQIWVTGEERVVWENVLELCRRVCGANVRPGQALEYIGAEFIATWAARTEENPPLEVEETQATQPEATAVEPTERAIDPTMPLWEHTRKFVLERDGWKCVYPGCNSRCELDVHHILFRSRGGCDEPWNAVAQCRFHHALIHAGIITLRGRAPFELEWTPPKLMQEVIERRRNNPSVFVGELDVWEWPFPGRREVHSG